MGLTDKEHAKILKDVATSHGLDLDELNKPLPGYDPRNPTLTSTGLGPAPMDDDERDHPGGWYGYQEPQADPNGDKAVTKAADVLDRGVDTARATFTKYYDGDYMSPGRPVSGSFEHLIQQVRDPLIAGCGCEYRPKLDDTGVANHSYDDGYKVPHHYPSVAATFGTRGIVACHECGKNWEVPYTIDDKDDKTSVTTGEHTDVLKAYITPEAAAKNDHDGDEPDAENT